MGWRDVLVVSLFLTAIYIIPFFVLFLKRSVLKKNAKIEDEKELVAKFLRDDVYPSSASMLEILDYSAFNFFKLRSILRVLIGEGRVEMTGSEKISYDSCFTSIELKSRGGRKRPKLRLVK
mgnify:CR=1 FL=1